MLRLFIFICKDQPFHFELWVIDNITLFAFVFIVILKFNWRFDCQFCQKLLALWSLLHECIQIVVHLGISLQSFFKFNLFLLFQVEILNLVYLKLCWINGWTNTFKFDIESLRTYLVYIVFIYYFDFNSTAQQINLSKLF